MSLSIRETGLLLDHAAADGVDDRDPDLVSGTMTAIRGFAKDNVTLIVLRSVTRSAGA